MVFQQSLRNRLRLSLLITVAGLGGFGISEAGATDGSERFADARSLYEKGQYFQAARYAFAAGEESSELQPQAYAWVTLALMKARLENSASYFFIQTLRSGKNSAIRQVLTQADALMVAVGPDVIRRYLSQYTRLDDYDARNRSAYLYAQGKELLLAGKEKLALAALSGVSRESEIYPYALQVQASAQTLIGDGEGAIRSFEQCAERAERVANRSAGGRGVDGVRAGRARAIASDLKNRCLAGKARVLYERGQHDEADIAYDQIDKSSIVWTDVLFEQAWNAFAKQEYNRALGKLVSYKSPLLKFVFNTETDVLRAQSYLALCLYDDANDAINEFNRRYSGIGQEVKRFVEQNDENLAAFFERGKRALRGPLQTEQTFDQILNRFVRSPYFRNLAQADSDVETELQQVDRFNVNQPGVTKNRGEGFAGFLRQVLSWRRKTARLLGGAFVKNALMDYHGALISDFEKMAFIKLEMLSRFKEKLMYPNRASRGRERGAREPSRRDDQMRWSFNGEFWTDELGDYVFGLESECGK